VTDARAPTALAPVAIGLCLTLIHLISIPVTNISVNQTRSIGPRCLGGSTSSVCSGWRPLVGAVLSGAVYRSVFAERKAAATTAIVTA
jgi:aquaporin Z